VIHPDILRQVFGDGSARQKLPMMPFAVAPISFTKLVAVNPDRSLMIGFVRNENFVSR